MKAYDSKEEIEKRASQEDPFIMYLIVRKSLGMSTGKIGAQCAHAAQMLLLKYHKYVMMSCSSYTNPEDLPFSKETYNVFTEWLDGSFRKVVLKADDKQWAKLKEEFSEKERVLVVDAGLTELEPGSETVIGLYPTRKSEASRLVRRLQVL